ncbi:MAG: hypothetical protein Hyperionvirus11_56 [Hyperionvirus sp.]|uniref:Uncharacterized protein n=1 Tax=Hyperionvirus sp. TaxID=2487770 RepID=A0A3G5AD18_9VIRU|nr:MAG: hypothetical protein Hyperionvirus11_56 [Hyperionvirus sp.]
MCNAVRFVRREKLVCVNRFAGVRWSRIVDRLVRELRMVSVRLFL